MRVLEQSISIDLRDLLDGETLDSVQTKLSAMMHEYEQERVDLDKEFRFSVEQHYDDLSVYLNKYRWETDAEFEKRRERSRRAREAAAKKREAEKEKARQKLFDTEQAERAEFERLKRKFEK